jgi:hypothetical protein
MRLRSGVFGSHRGKRLSYFGEQLLVSATAEGDRGRPERVEGGTQRVWFTGGKIAGNAMACCRQLS